MLTHPKLAVAVVGVPAASVALNVGRWFLGSVMGQQSVEMLLVAILQSTMFS